MRLTLPLHTVGHEPGEACSSLRTFDIVVYAVVQALFYAWPACGDRDELEVRMTLITNCIEAALGLDSINRRSVPPGCEAIVPG